MDTLERDILSRARYLSINEYPRDTMSCIRQAVEELLDENTIITTCTLFEVTRNEYLNEDFYKQLYDDYMEIYFGEKR